MVSDINKKCLCITCAKLKRVTKDGWIICPEFPKVKESKEYGMNVILHCYGSCHETK